MKTIDVKIDLGTARAVAEFAHFAITQGVTPDWSELQALRKFASAVAGPVYGNALGKELGKFDGEVKK